jgi:hypothetical protein
MDVVPLNAKKFSHCLLKLKKKSGKERIKAGRYSRKEGPKK